MNHRVLHLMHKCIFNISILILIFLTSCQSEIISQVTPTKTDSTFINTPKTYPKPFQSQEEPILPEGGVRFSLEKPIFEGTTQIVGVGTPGIPIIIYDVTFMGEILGQGLINQDGTFNISVSPLEAGHRIGIGLGVLSGSKWQVTDFQNPAFNGDEARQVPMVGFFFDTAMVQEKTP